ncbi:hypothetical protein ACSNOI_26305 [Actinomadura kijaniata]|uniref:hypothetical protein n=1 Tax=Actinomadura kijaniata TaxID=46161 RepID=UPI003F1E0B3F
MRNRPRQTEPRQVRRRRTGRPPGRREPDPLLSTRALMVLLAAGGAGAVAALVPESAVPIGVAVAVVTLLAQIVRD